MPNYYPKESLFGNISTAFALNSLYNVVDKFLKNRIINKEVKNCLMQIKSKSTSGILTNYLTGSYISYIILLLFLKFPILINVIEFLGNNLILLL